MIAKGHGRAKAQVEGGRQDVAAPFDEERGDQWGGAAEQGCSDVVADREAGIALRRGEQFGNSGKEWSHVAGDQQREQRLAPRSYGAGDCS